ncbi:MAG: hypothetical protein QOH06_957 [Acidobacteriota bacterium]|jgi:hypothetical protein|nr:hypothetical protein [Acidobacteriota bacterium]
MNREIPGEVAMTFQVRDLMSNVFPMEMADQPCKFDSTGNHGCPPCPPPSKCQGASDCPSPSKKPSKVRLEMLSVLRDQMRQALLPA